MAEEFSIVLLRPEIPHNTGAIGRLCVGLGVKLNLVRPLGFQLDDKSVARAGLDYWPHLEKAIHDTWEDYLAAERPKRVFFLQSGLPQQVFSQSRLQQSSPLLKIPHPARPDARRLLTRAALVSVMSLFMAFSFHVGPGTVPGDVQ